MQRVMLIAALMTACAGIMLAQATSGVITGLIIDPTGAPVPNVTIEIRNQDTNELRRVASNQVGMYEVPNLVAGLYT